MKRYLQDPGVRATLFTVTPLVLATIAVDQQPGLTILAGIWAAWAAAGVTAVVFARRKHA